MVPLTPQCAVPWSCNLSRSTDPAKIEIVKQWPVPSRVKKNGRPFTVRTDHNALKWLQSFKEPEGQVARWLEMLAQYDYRIEHRTGKKHQNAVALSRNPLPVPVTDEAIETNIVESGKQAWLQGWTAANMQSKQEADPNLKQMLLWKRDRAAQPTQQEIQGASKATKSLWAQWNRL